MYGRFYPLTDSNTITTEWQWLDYKTDADALKDHKLRATIAEAPAYDPLTHRLVETAPVLQGLSVAVGWEVVELSADEAKAAKRAAIVAALATSDAAYKPRWAEDARRGQAPHESEQAWLDEREALRGQLAALAVIQ